MRLLAGCISTCSSSAIPASSHPGISASIAAFHLEIHPVQFLTSCISAIPSLQFQPRRELPFPLPSPPSQAHPRTEPPLSPLPLSLLPSLPPLIAGWTGRQRRQGLDEYEVHNRKWESGSEMKRSDTKRKWGEGDSTNATLSKDERKIRSTITYTESNNEIESENWA